jgi:homoserine acetyltransferase
MRFPHFPSKFLVAAVTALAVVLILALSASVHAGDKHKNKRGRWRQQAGAELPATSL